MSLLRIASRALPFGLPLLLLLHSGSAFSQQAAPSQQSGPAAVSAPDHALIYPFAVDTNTADALRPSSEACPRVIDPARKVTDKLNPHLIDAISHQLQKKLAKKMPADIATADSQPQPGWLIFAGCLITVDPGSPAKRMAGMNLGASHLAAHVIVRRQMVTGPQTLAVFDVSVKGGNPLPPLGPIGVATHAATELRETLNADAKRMADRILKTFADRTRDPNMQPVPDQPPATQPSQVP